MNCKYLHLVSNQLTQALMFLVIFSFVAYADTIVQHSSKTYGRIVSLSPQAITVSEGCTGPRRTIVWSEIAYVTIDDKCGGDQILQRTAPVLLCPVGDSVESVLSVRFKAGQQTYADQLQYDEGQPMVITLPSGRGVIQGPLKEVDQLRQIATCTSTLNDSKNFRWPQSFSLR